MTRRQRALALAVAIAALAGAIATTAAADGAIVSDNWAGYVAKGRRAHTRFSRVLASWTEPAATCNAGQASYAAFWLGLGGYAAGASKLEQAGTEADCNRGGHAVYGAWYELVPDPPVGLTLAIHPGDRIAASVSAGSDDVEFHLRDLTTGRTATRRIRFRSPETSTAEWIAEAPSYCNGELCAVLPLTNFGSVAFSDATAVTAKGHRGPVDDPAWSAIPIEMQGDLDAFGSVNRPTFDGATASALAGAGSLFSITWQQTAAPAPTVLPIGPPGAPPPEGAEQAQ